MLGQIFAMALVLALAARFIECLCSKKERQETTKHQIIAILRNFSLMSLLLYIYFLVFVVPKQGSRITAAELSTMATDLEMVGGGAHLKRSIEFTPDKVPMEWPSQEALTKSMCESVRPKHVPNIKEI